MSPPPRTNFIIAFINRRSHNAIERQQLIIYIIATANTLVGMPMHLLNVLGARNAVLLSLSAVFIAGALLTFVLWLCHKLSLTAALTTYAIVAQTVQSTKMVFITIALPSAYDYLIIINGFVSMELVFALAISYLRIATMSVGTINLLTLLFSGAVIGGNSTLWQFIVLCVLFTIFNLLLTDMMYRNVKHIQDENTAFRTGEKRLLQTLRLNRKEITAYIEMCRTDNPADSDTDRLFSMLSESSQRNVINAVERKKAIDMSRNADLKTLFPDFTPMELEVARLVLRDMKLKQIASLTGKSETNISVVRSRLRKKLGLSPTDDLRNALIEETRKNAS